MSRPENLKYTKTHEWARVDGDIVSVGITDHAVEQLGDLAFIDLCDVGTELESSSRFGEIESTKTVSELFAPVSGEVTEVNTELVENLQLVTDSPFERGWMVKIRMANADELGALLSAAQYAEHIEREEH